MNSFAISLVGVRNKGTWVTEKRDGATAAGRYSPSVVSARSTRALRST